MRSPERLRAPRRTRLLHRRAIRVTGAWPTRYRRPRQAAQDRPLIRIAEPDDALGADGLGAFRAHRAPVMSILSVMMCLRTYRHRQTGHGVIGHINLKGFTHHHPRRIAAPNGNQHPHERAIHDDRDIIRVREPPV